MLNHKYSSVNKQALSSLWRQHFFMDCGGVPNVVSTECPHESLRTLRDLQPCPPLSSYPSSPVAHKSEFHNSLGEKKIFLFDNLIAQTNHAADTGHSSGGGLTKSGACSCRGLSQTRRSGTGLRFHMECTIKALCVVSVCQATQNPVYQTHESWPQMKNRRQSGHMI